MERIKLGVDWIDEMLPDGFPVATSTLVSGPGGSGKPLVGFIFSSGWLRNNGKVIFLLTSTNLEYLQNTMKLLGTNLDDYIKKLFFIEFNPTIDDIKKETTNHIQANLVKPEIWNKSLQLADNYLNSVSSEIGTMVVGSALNLLFFSKTYGKVIHKKIKEILEKEKSRTFFFTVNSDAFKDMVLELERVSDNLMFSRMEQPMTLFLKTSRMKAVSFNKEEIKIPLSKDVLESIKKEAEKGKKNLIPTLKGI
ncbi:MAG: hypothetical protein B5M53_06990 [Candidatus Cloacimonas sp. 4484_209]|nr:MAG: hypothetical protein B5M53_06990 [Candidatus Cloacimonas sp. 4484_209]